MQSTGLAADIAAATARARKGAAWLDETAGPEWDQMRNLNRLDIKNPIHCVLALLRSQGVTSTILYINISIYCGFSCGLLMEFLVHVFRPPAAVRSFELISQAWKLGHSARAGTGLSLEASLWDHMGASPRVALGRTSSVALRHRVWTAPATSLHSERTAHLASPLELNLLELNEVWRAEAISWRVLLGTALGLPPKAHGNQA